MEKAREEEDRGEVVIGITSAQLDFASVVLEVWSARLQPACLPGQ